MSRAYSGNLNDYRDAVSQLVKDHSVSVRAYKYQYNDVPHHWMPAIDLETQICTTLWVLLEDGSVLTSKSFDDSDEDVRCNNQTSWLRKVHSDLNHWK